MTSFAQLCEIAHFRDPENEDPMDNHRKLRFLLEYIIADYKENYTPEEHLAIDQYPSLWKGQVSFCIYIPTKRERYGIKIFMPCESKTAYLLNFIIYASATTQYPNQTDPLVMNTKIHLKLFFPCFMIVYIRVIVSHRTIITPPQD